MMTQYFPIIVEEESNGTVSAWAASAVRAPCRRSWSSSRSSCDRLRQHRQSPPGADDERDVTS
jgi:hypothetical protein